MVALYSLSLPVGSWLVIDLEDEVAAVPGLGGACGAPGAVFEGGAIAGLLVPKSEKSIKSGLFGLCLLLV